MLALLSLLAATAVSSPTAATWDEERASHVVILTAHAEGAQIYQCKAGPDGVLLWSFREPIASLIVDGKTVGRHYAGPHWALDDGSLLQGKLVTSTPGTTSTDIPRLKLAVIENKGLGALSTATLVYRVKTLGGALTGGCAGAGMLRTVAYSADYIFSK